MTRAAARRRWIRRRAGCSALPTGGSTTPVAQGSRRGRGTRWRRATWWCGCAAAPFIALPLLTALRVVQGLLLDLDAATLTLYANGERKGVMVRPGMIDDEDEPVGRLEGPLRWAVDLRDASVAIAGPLPLPA